MPEKETITKFMTTYPQATSMDIWTQLEKVADARAKTASNFKQTLGAKALLVVKGRPRFGLQWLPCTFIGRQYMPSSTPRKLLDLHNLILVQYSSSLYSTSTVLVFNF